MRKFLVTLFFSIMFFSTSIYASQLNVYPFAEEIGEYKDFSLTVNDQKIRLYSVRVNNYHSWTEKAEEKCTYSPVAMFDFSGEISVKLELNFNPKKAVVRPLDKNIVADIKDNTISFNISKPGNYVVEIDDNSDNCLMIFANDIAQGKKEGSYTLTAKDLGDHPETDGPAYFMNLGIENGNDFYLPSGLHTGTIYLTDNQSLYMEKGSVLRGKIVCEGSNVKIYGRGIIDGSHLKDWLYVDPVLPVDVYRRKDITVEGITIFDPNAWCMQFQITSGITVDGVKMVSSRCNSDGISLQNTNDVEIKNCFIRTWDDGVVVKNYQTSNTSYNINVHDNLFWTDLAQSMEIGVETNKGKKADPTIHDVIFNNNRVLYAKHKAPISIHNGDNCDIYSITFSNTVIENYQAGNGDGWNYLIDITNLTGKELGSSAWTKVAERGKIRDVNIENIYVLDGKVPSGRIKNSSTGGVISKLKLKNIYYKGEKISLNSFDVGNDADVELIYEDTTTENTTQELIYGDVDENGSVTASDAANVLSHVLNSDLMPFDDKKKKLADVSGDGIITSNDASMILSKVLNADFVF